MKERCTVYSKVTALLCLRKMQPVFGKKKNFYRKGLYKVLYVNVPSKVLWFEFEPKLV